MNAETRDLALSFDRPNAVLNTLRSMLKLALDSPQAWAAGILPLRDWHRVMIIDADGRRAQYLAQLVSVAGYRSQLAVGTLDAFTLFLRGSFVPAVILVSQEEAADNLFLMRLVQQVYQKYRWDIPIIRLHYQQTGGMPVVSRAPQYPQLPPPATPPIRQIQPTRVVQPRTSTRPLPQLHPPLSASDESRTGNLPPLRSPLHAGPLPTTPLPTGAAPETGVLPDSMIAVSPLPNASSLQQSKTDKLPPVRLAPSADSASSVAGLRTSTTRRGARPASLPGVTPSSRKPSPSSLSGAPVSSATSLSGVAAQGSLIQMREVERKSLEEQNLGRYQVQALVGKGSIGDVYLAYDRLRETQVALKSVQRNALLDSFLDDNFIDVNLYQQEMDMLADLKHPHILHPLTCGKSYVSGTPFYYKIMPFYPEGSLGSWRYAHGNRPFSPREVMPVAMQIADALRHAHEQQVLFQNFKLTNILLQGDVVDDMRRLHVFLTDFALKGEDGSLLRSFDTLRYIAPEQWEGRSLFVSDQYGLAALLYELLAGRPPFQGNQEQLLRHMHLALLPQPPSAFNTSVTPAIDRVILRALAKNPHDRFVTIIEFANALRDA